MLNSYDQYKLTNEAYGIDEDNLTDSYRIMTTPEDFIGFFKRKGDGSDNGAILILTGKQYIFRINGKNGRQGHIFSFAKSYLEMEGKQSELTLAEASRITINRENNYINFTIEAETSDNGYLYKNIFANIPLKGISREEFESFKIFYNTFKEVIEKAHFNFDVRVRGEIIHIDGIDGLYHYLESIINDKKASFEYKDGEKIIGVSNGISKGQVK